MWTAKITFDGSKWTIGSRTLKYKISFVGFPLSYYYQKKWIIINISGIMLGENKQKFIRDWKKSGRLLNFELNGDFFVGIIKEPISTRTIYNPLIIHLSPALIDERGMEIIEIGCFKRESLNKAITTLEKKFDARVIYIKERKIKSVSIVRENPDLTEKQRKAIELAIKNGYYNYPRKIELEKLAKLMNISYSTFHAHLRKAEQKLIPFFSALR